MGESDPRPPETQYERIVRERADDLSRARVSLYDLGRSIGEGNFAKVRLGTHCLTQSKVAVKIVDKTKLSEAALLKLTREVKLMKLLNHPNICRLYEMVETKSEVFLVMEYAEGGELFDYLVARVRMKEKDARRYFRQLVSALDYCHSYQIIHRDLKAENLLMDNNLNAKIADFGFSNQFTVGQQLSTWCGSPPYAAPELFQGRQYTGPEVDIWSLGVVLYVLICGALPFDGTTLSMLRSRVLSGKFKVPLFMSTECERLVKRMLVVDPLKRATMQEIKNDPWLNDGFDEPLGEPRSAEIAVEPQAREKVFGIMAELGLPRESVIEALEKDGFDPLSATFHILYDDLFARVPVTFKSPDVRQHAATVLSSTSTSAPPQSAAAMPPSSEAEAESSPPPPSAGSHLAVPDTGVPRSRSPPRSPPSAMPPTTSTKYASRHRERRYTANSTVPRVVDLDAMRNEMLRRRVPQSGAASAAAAPTEALAPVSDADEPSDAVTSASTPALPPVSSASEQSLPSDTSLSSIASVATMPSFSTSAASAAPAPSSRFRKKDLSVAIPVTTYQQGPMTTESAAISVATTPQSTVGTPQSTAGTPQSAKPPQKRRSRAFTISTSLLMRTGSSASSTGPTPPVSPTASVAPPASSFTARTPRSSEVASRRQFFARLKPRFWSPREPSAADAVEPRSKLFHLSVRTTSSKDPSAILQEVQRVLVDTETPFELSGYVFVCSREDLAFEVEICRLGRASLYGLRFKRTSGDKWRYKELCEQLTACLKL